LLLRTNRELEIPTFVRPGDSLDHADIFLHLYAVSTNPGKRTTRLNSPLP
jgi:hypothetical protein